jgi:membrane fusion protein, multidrug efflux system
MKKIIIALAFSAFLIACKKEAKDLSIEDLIKAKDLKALQARKTALQTDIAKIEEELGKVETKKGEALVAIKTVNDTVFNHYLDIQGALETKENVLVQPEMAGTLVTLNAKAGQHVSRGQILGRVDDSGMSQQLAGAESQYALAKTTYERQKNLWDQKIGSEIQYLQAKTQMVSAQKGVAQIKAGLSKTIIRAPFSGTIDEVFVDRGEVVAPSPQGLMRILNLNDMYVKTTVPEKYIGKLKVGSHVDVFITSLNKNYKGKVRQVGNFINPNNRSFGIEISIPNKENALRPNQVAQLKIVDYTNKNALVVPTNVIQTDGEGNKFVFVASQINGTSGIAKKIIVKTGMSSENVTEISSGLSGQDVIVTEGYNTISEGMKLNF